MARRSGLDIETLKEKLADAKDRIAELEEQFEDRVRDHPVQSVGIAFAIGVVGGALLSMVMRRR